MPDPFRHTNRSPARRHLKAGLMAALAFAVLELANPIAAGSPAATPWADPQIALIRVGFARSLFRDVNENDARAALKAYTSALARDNKLTDYPDPLVFEGTAEMADALRRKNVDIIAAPASDLFALPEDLVTGPYMVAVNARVIGLEYLLLARADGQIATVADLRGRRVAVLNNLQGSLATCWFEVLLGTSGLGSPAQFLAELKPAPKPTLAILPVFFGQLDACVVTREAFALVGEMNPQVARQLRVLATSPAVIPMLTCFRQGMDPEFSALLLNTVVAFQNSIPGRQVLTLFQSERVEPREAADIASTRQLLADRARLYPAQSGPPPMADRSVKSPANP